MGSDEILEEIEGAFRAALMEMKSRKDKSILKHLYVSVYQKIQPKLKELSEKDNHSGDEK